MASDTTVENDLATVPDYDLSETAKFQASSNRVIRANMAEFNRCFDTIEPLTRTINYFKPISDQSSPIDLADCVKACQLHLLLERLLQHFLPNTSWFEPWSMLRQLRGNPTEVTIMVDGIEKVETVQWLTLNHQSMRADFLKLQHCLGVALDQGRVQPGILTKLADKITNNRNGQIDSVNDTTSHIDRDRAYLVAMIVLTLAIAVVAIAFARWD